MKANKNFSNEFGSTVSYKIEPEAWIPWLLDRFFMLVFLFCVLAMGAFAQYLVPLMVLIFAGIGALGVAVLLISYVAVIVSNDHEDDGSYPGS